MTGRVRFGEDEDITESLMGNNRVTYQAPEPPPPSGMPQWLQNLIAPLGLPQSTQNFGWTPPIRQPAQWTNTMVAPAPDTQPQPFEPMYIQPPELPTFKQPQRSYQRPFQPEAAKYPGGYNITPQRGAGYNRANATYPTPAPGTPLLQGIFGALTQPGQGMSAENMEANLLQQPGTFEDQARRQAVIQQRAASAANKRRYTPFGAEQDGTSGGWTPQQIASANQMDLRQFYSLDPRERYWLARAITMDNPRLYGKSGLASTSTPEANQTGAGNYGYGMGNVPYKVSTGGSGGGYAQSAPEWYLNMISWSI